MQTTPSTEEPTPMYPVAHRSFVQQNRAFLRGVLLLSTLLAMHIWIM